MARVGPRHTSLIAASFKSCHVPGRQASQALVFKGLAELGSARTRGNNVVPHLPEGSRLTLRQLPPAGASTKLGKFHAPSSPADKSPPSPGSQESCCLPWAQICMAGRGLVRKVWGGDGLQLGQLHAFPRNLSRPLRLGVGDGAVTMTQLVLSPTARSWMLLLLLLSGTTKARWPALLTLCRRPLSLQLAPLSSGAHTSCLLSPSACWGPGLWDSTVVCAGLGVCSPGGWVSG